MLNEEQEHLMAYHRRELYRSAPNGDSWSLIRDSQSGRVWVEHEPNASSGGQMSRMEVGDFLAHGGHGPEHQALMRLIGTLVKETVRS
ncbi:MAG: hypothetical protein ACREFI_05340 [Stellaceae bacterium]